MTNLEKVRALVAKANSTEFEGEARVFREKAEQLIVKYGLRREDTGIDGQPIKTAEQFDALKFFRERQEQHRREMRRGPGGRYTQTQLYLAAQLRHRGWAWSSIGARLGIKATGHLAKTLKEQGYL
jgi:hypothetical protein